MTLQPPRARLSPTGRRLALFASILTSVALTCGAIEIGLRSMGYRPYRPLRQFRAEPPINQRDPVLGWVPVPGSFRFGPYRNGEDAVQVTIRPDGARVTSRESLDGRPRLVLLGCSFTFGWAVADDQSWAWGLQQRRPDLEVVNHGVGGYGTLQSLMLLERLLRDGPQPAYVLYGLIWQHENRNVAEPMWLRSIRGLSRLVATPYATLGADGRAVRHGPVAYRAWPLNGSSALVAYLEEYYYSRTIPALMRRAKLVTEELISEMDELCRARHIPFSVVVLSGLGDDPMVGYRTRLAAKGIDVIDCNVVITRDLLVAGEGHPNGRVHARWADCVAGALASRMRPPDSHTAQE